VPQHRGSGLGPIALAPGGAGEAPADLDLGADKIERGEQDPAEKCRTIAALEHGPVAEPWRIAMCDPGHDEGGVAGCVRPRHFDEANDEGVVIHGDRGGKVPHGAGPQDQPFGGEDR